MKSHSGAIRLPWQQPAALHPSPAPPELRPHLKTRVDEETGNSGTSVGREVQ